MNPTETWKPVPNNDGFEASTLGRIRRTTRTRTRITMNPTCGAMTSHGYMSVYLRGGRDNEVKGYVHRLVAFAFIPNPENKPEINHKNGIRNDNRVENLEWVTGLENKLHRSRVLGLEIGEKHHAAKLTNADIPVIRARAASGETYASIAKDYPVARTVISRIARGIAWFVIESGDRTGLRRKPAA